MRCLLIISTLLLIACGGGSSNDSGSGANNQNAPAAMCIDVEGATGGYIADVFVADDNQDVVQIEWSVYRGQFPLTGPETIDVEQTKTTMTFEIFMEVELDGGGVGYTFYFTAVDNAGHQSNDASWSIWVE